MLGSGAEVKSSISLLSRKPRATVTPEPKRPLRV